jgi:glycosyltransferase involved in cell wall biosynthesis
VSTDVGTEAAYAGTDDVDVSIVLPVYNEKGHLRQEIDRIRAAMDASEFSYELVVVDDGSNDGSSEALRDIEGIRLIQFLTNRGSGSARKFGTRAARGRIVVWTDVDMSYPNDLIPELVREMEGYDQVVGARTTEEGTHKAFRVPAKLFIRKLASYLVQTPIPDLNSGMRAFRRDVALQYVSQLPAGFSCVTTITMTFLAHGYTVKYWPITYSERAGTSKFHWWTDTRRYLLQVIRMTLSYDPFRVFLPIGFLFSAVGVVKLGYDVTQHDFKVAINTLLIFLVAFQVFVVGMLADLVGRATRPCTRCSRRPATPATPPPPSRPADRAPPPATRARERGPHRVDLGRVAPHRGRPHREHLRQVRLEEPGGAPPHGRLLPGARHRAAGHVAAPDPGGGRGRGRGHRAHRLPVARRHHRGARPARPRAGRPLGAPGSAGL